ncbi:phenylacetate--CoA ligase family protein [Candidatus Bipolaricaulota bacterium]
MSWARRLITTLWLALRGRAESQVPFRSERAIRRRQTRNLRRIVAHAFRNVPYFQEVARSEGLSERDILSCEDLCRLPLIDGRALHTNPMAFVSQAFPRASLVMLHSTGTAAYGAKTVFWHPRELMYGITYGERDRRVLRKLLGKSHNLVRLSFHHPVSSTSDVSRFQASRTWVPSAIMKTHWASGEMAYDEVARLFDELHPDVVYSYGSFAEYVLLHILAGNLTGYLPKVWVFGADGVSEQGRRTIAENLPCALYSTYQAVETGRIGFECEMRSGYHINTDVCHVRIVNERGETVAPGEVGEVVVSNLVNRGSILLNYRLGDYAAWGTEPCSCGRTLPLLRLTGARTTSTLRLRNGGELQEHEFVLACKESISEVLQFQIIENAPESIVWRVALSRVADREQIVSDLMERSRSVMSPEADVRVEIVDRIVLPPGAKLTRIVRSSHDTAGSQVTK